MTFRLYVMAGRHVFVHGPSAAMRTGAKSGMARWPRHAWTSVFTYGAVFVLFPVLCWLAYAWVRGWLF